MSLEMSESSFEYAIQVTQNDKTVHVFFELMKGDQSETSVLYRSVMNMLNKYVEHMRIKAGVWWSHERAVYETSLWRWYAAYILAGLYAIYGKNFPRLRPGRIEVLERECDAPQSILEKMTLDHEEILCSFGEVSRAWIYNFRLSTSDYPSFLCRHGILYIYALGVAVIAAKEDRGDDASLSDAEHQDVALRDTRLGVVKTEIEEVLEKMQFD